MFLTLWNAHVGDLVQITTPRGGEIDYRVTEIHPRVDTRDVSWLRETTSPRLTLQTSTGPNATDPKFVVIAVPD
jgi:sortase (surface protein transpeptidase)